MAKNMSSKSLLKHCEFTDGLFWHRRNWPWLFGGLTWFQVIVVGVIVVSVDGPVIGSLASVHMPVLRALLMVAAYTVIAGAIGAFVAWKIDLVNKTSKSQGQFVKDWIKYRLFHGHYVNGRRYRRKKAHRVILSIQNRYSKGV